jgi:hypothetical protein
MEKTAASRAQAKVSGGPGYEGYEVEFRFTPDAPIADAGLRAFVGRVHALRLANSWFPGPQFLQKYGIARGRSLDATLKQRVSGACTPLLFAFPGVDLADYFERAP